ncbi:unnamed protein product [Cunninghamella echinulata]
MTDSYSYQPVIRIPNKNVSQKDSMNAGGGGTPIRNNIDHFLVSDTLFVNNLPNSIRETDIRTLLQHCMPVEMHIRREDDEDSEESYLRFSSPRYADRAYTLYHGFKFTNGATLQLRMYRDASLDPEAQGDILEISNLAPETDDIHRLYDIFRPFGPLQLCLSTGDGTAMIQYFEVSDSEEAMAQMDGATLYDYKIKITPQAIDKDPTTPGMTPPSLSPPPLSPRDTLQQQQQQLQYSQQQQQQQQQQQTPKLTSKPYIDYLNLYVKNMDPLITNDHLIALFEKYGKIVSARVISHPTTKQSRGYGFVSFANEDDAARALQEMHGQIVFSKPLFISYHEPKKGRNDHNNNNTNNHNNNHNHNNNITHNKNQNMVPINNIHNHQIGNIMKSDQSDYSNVSMSHHSVSNSIESEFNKLSMAPPSSSPFQQQYQQQESLSPIVNLPRKRNQDPINEYVHPSTAMMEEINPYKNTATIKLPQSKNNNNHDNTSVTKSPSPVFQGSPSNNTATTPSLASLATGLSIQKPPNYMDPSHSHYYSSSFDQQQYNHHQNNNYGHGTLRRRGSIESISSIMTDSSASLQRQKLTDAVNRCVHFDSARVSSIVDLLLTLKRKERSLCLFNTDFLKEKIEAALDALDTFEDDEDDDDGEDDISHQVAVEENIPYNHNGKIKGSNETSHKYLQNQQYHQQQSYLEQMKNSSTQSTTFIPTSNSFNTSNNISPIRRVSKAIPIVAPPSSASNKSPANNSTTESNNKTNTSQSSNTSNSNSNSNNRLPVTSPTPNVSESKSNVMTKEEIDGFLDSIASLPLHTQKHKLGEIMWNYVKPLARPLAKNKKVPGFSSKVLIHLLDNVPLPELAHGINNNSWLQKQVEIAANAVHTTFTT